VFPPAPFKLATLGIQLLHGLRALDRERRKWWQEREPRRPQTLRSQTARYPFAPYPRGWYGFAYADDIHRGDVRTVHALGEEWVVWRGQSGAVGIASATCPHLGAHLGVGGRVVNDSVRCRMHGFCFEPDGTCTATGYDSRPTAKTRAKVLPAVERAGFIMGYYDPDGVDAAWELPPLLLADPGPMHRIFFRMGCHAQDIAENTVDIGHFASTHGYSKVEQIARITSDARTFRTRYALTRSANIFGSPKSVRVAIDFKLHGLGLFEIEGHTEPGGVVSRFVFASTPVTPDQLDFRIGLWCPRAGDGGPSRLAALIPQRLKRQLIGHMIALGTRLDVAQDVRVLNRKRYLERPALAKGDGRIGEFRAWAKQFYPQLAPMMEGSS